jgi:hypothetical protein
VKDRVLRVVGYVFAAVVAVLVVLRVFRVARLLTVVGFVGTILAAGYLLLGPLLTIPRFTTEGPVVRITAPRIRPSALTATSGRSKKVILPSAWNGDSRKFAFNEFSEIRQK